MAAIHTLKPIILLLSCGVISVLLLPALSISPIVGFLLAGLALGPYGFNLIPNNEAIHLLGELGVVFLLFDIGLHFSLKNVWQERRGIFIFGPLQVLITAVIFFLFFLTYHQPFDITMMLSLTFALSSTAVVAQTLKENGLTGSPNSRTSLAILIFQDICAIFLLILANTIGKNTTLGTEIFYALMKCIASFVVAVILGRYLMKPLFKRLIRFNNTEVFTMIALLLVIVTGVATAQLGLSLTLGAFLTGMIIAETPFKHIIQTELRPFRFLLLSFFFVTVGMEIDINIILNDWFEVLCITITAMSIKAISIFALFRIFGERRCKATQQAALLIQGSEFLFVIIAAPAIQQVLPNHMISILVTSVAISMAISSFVFKFARTYAMRGLNQSACENDNTTITNKPRVAISGMNETGLLLASTMQHFNIPYVAIEKNYLAFLKARASGYPVVYGDKADFRFWENLGIHQFEFLIICDPDRAVATKYKDITPNRFPKLTRYVAVNSHEDMNIYRDLKMKPILTLSVPKGLEVVERILSDVSIPTEEIAHWLDTLSSEPVNTNPQDSVA